MRKINVSMKYTCRKTCREAKHYKIIKAGTRKINVSER